jgi:hypothetical protein
VDVLLVGTPDRDAAYDAAARAQDRLGREVNVTIRTPQQWSTGTDGFTAQLRSSPLLEIRLPGQGDGEGEREGDTARGTGDVGVSGDG